MCHGDMTSRLINVAISAGPTAATVCASSFYVQISKLLDKANNRDGNTEFLPKYVLLTFLTGGFNYAVV